MGASGGYGGINESAIVKDIAILFIYDGELPIPSLPIVTQRLLTTHEDHKMLISFYRF